MASSNFWRDLAVEFRAVPHAWTLSAQWAQGAVAGHWIVTGTRDGIYSFEALARRAAAEFGDASISDLLAAWLDQLRHERFGFKEATGRIVSVCRVSADFCKTLESVAVQSEFEEKKRRALVPMKTEAEEPEPLKDVARRVKKQDLSRYLNAARLTDRQHECASLRWEYGLSVSQIARELGLHRKTVDQHLHSSQDKMNKSGQYEAVRKHLAKFNADN